MTCFVVCHEISNAVLSEHVKSRLLVHWKVQILSITFFFRACAVHTFANICTDLNTSACLGWIFKQRNQAKVSLVRLCLSLISHLMFLSLSVQLFSPHCARLIRFIKQNTCIRPSTATIMPAPVTQSAIAD